MKKNEKRRDNGITLVALVITIIILLILAGISISSLTGSGLFQMAQESTRISEIKEIEEVARISYMERQLNEINSGEKATIADVISDLKEKGYDIKKITEGEGNITGIEVSEQNVEIEQNAEKTLTYRLVYSDGENERYFVEVQGKDYEIIFNNGNITINTKESNISEIYIKPEVTVETSDSSIIEANIEDEETIKLNAKNKEGNVEITIKEKKSNVTKIFKATTSKIKIEMAKAVSGNYANATITIVITYNEKMSKIILNGEELPVPEIVDGKNTVTKQVTKNGTYKVDVVSISGKTSTSSIVINEIADDMDIYNLEDLKRFRTMVNSGATFRGKTINVRDNINLNNENWTPIGNETRWFEGTFEGNNRVISGLYINTTSSSQGLFGVTGWNARINNLEISGNLERASHDTGCLVGINRGTISRCKNSATINISGRNNYGMGGIVGCNFGIIENCCNVAELLGGDSVGGIAGNNGGIIRGCYNTGNIRTSWCTVGGIVGHNRYFCIETRLCF